MFEWGDDLLLLFERGGGILWAILGVSMLLWMLILERYSYHLLVLPRHRRRLLEQWRSARGADPSARRFMKSGVLAWFGAPMLRHLDLIRTLVEVLPLLGLLGTISGMIKVFDVITLFGAGNARGMAAGISEALITTMAGLVTALSGMYFSANLESMARREGQRFEAALNRDAAEGGGA